MLYAMGAFTYPRSEPGSGGHLDLVELLNRLTPALRRELGGLADAAAATRPSDHEWSIKEVLSHLISYSDFLHERLRRTIQLEEPRLPVWDQHDELAARNAQAQSVSDLLAALAAKRAETVEMLSDLVHWNWARQARHETLGRISIRQLVERAIAHDDNHLAQIRALKEGLAAAP